MTQIHRTILAIPVLSALALTCLVYRQASAAPYIAVGQAKLKKSVIAIPAIQADGTSAKAAKEVVETINSDLAFMDIFKFLDAKAFVERPGAGLTPDRFKLSDWTSIGAEFLVKTGMSVEGKNLVLEGYLYDTFGNKQILAKRYVGKMSEAKTIGHTFANDIVNSLTGLPGIFLTKIAMVCDRTKKKEIYMMDFDGTDVKQITHRGSIALAPAWSPDGTKIAFSLFTKKKKNNVKNIDLYEYDFTKNTIRMLTNRTGMNSGAVYSPDGKKIALTMSFLGNPEIFLLDPITRNVERLTKSFGFDVDPSFSPDGKQLAFVSSRSGMPMVYSMSLDGSNVKRLTYAGKYNATPSWSPQNNKIAFAGYIDGRFDIFVMNPDGTNIERLTKNQGNNEDPHFSPDGNFLVFSSTRTGQRNIYVMNVDGTFVKRLTYGLGNCSAPKWSAPPQNQGG